MAFIMVFDTETTSLEKPFAYNIGYVILDTDTKAILAKKDFICEQVWHNLPLFSTAYYAEKRDLYVQAMRKHQTIMDKYGYILQQMRRDMKNNNVTSAYAYNSPFDDKVITFNCDWFKTLNPFDTIPIYDIRGMVSEFITNTEEYKSFCEENQYFTDSGNYSGTAETVYRYLTDDTTFIEAHTALADSEIEAEILLACLDMDAEIEKEYKVASSISRLVSKPLKISIDGSPIFEGSYISKINRKEHIIIKTK